MHCTNVLLPLAIIQYRPAPSPTRLGWSKDFILANLTLITLATHVSHLLNHRETVYVLASSGTTVTHKNNNPINMEILASCSQLLINFLVDLWGLEIEPCLDW